MTLIKEEAVLKMLNPKSKEHKAHPQAKCYPKLFPVSFEEDIFLSKFFIFSRSFNESKFWGKHSLSEQTRRPLRNAIQQKSNFS